MDYLEKLERVKGCRITTPEAVGTPTPHEVEHGDVDYRTRMRAGAKEGQLGAKLDHRRM